jgi:hypothetical protein
MSSSVNGPARARRSTGQLWYGMVAPPTAWAAQGLIDSDIGTRFCAFNLQPMPGPVRTLVLLASSVSLGLSLSGAVVGWRLWRRGAPEGDLSGADRYTFMALVGFMVGVICTLAILAGAVPAAMARVCGEIR